MHKGVALKEY